MKNFVRPVFLIGVLSVLVFTACMKQEKRVPASDDYSPDVIKLIKTEQN